MPGPADTRCSSYTYGQCTFGACRYASWVPEGLGNANEWGPKARAKGYQTTDIPTVGAVAVFNDANIYNMEFGHCGVVRAVASYDRFQVEEMNFTSWNVYDQRWASRAGLLGFVLPPGVAPGAGAGPVAATLPRALTLEVAWQDLASFWNYVVDAEVNGMQRVTAQIDLIN